MLVYLIPFLWVVIGEEVKFINSSTLGNKKRERKREREREMNLQKCFVNLKEKKTKYIECLVRV